VPKLVVHDRDRTLLLDLAPGESLLVGRSHRCEVPIQAPRASRRHCEIVAREGGHAVRDLGSTNGTTLNGAPFEGDRPLADGDVIDAAGCRILYRSGP